jgi:DNA-binding GntR family transcriptional regulator
LLSDPSLVGTFINEAELAETVGVSRTPVREALLLLSAEGLVQLVPNRGAFVPPLSPDQVHQVLQARAVIESWAAGEALRNLKVPLASMQASLDRQAALPEDADPSEFIAADRDFHEALVIAGGNEVMTKMYETVRSRHVVIGVAAILRDRESRLDVVAEHQGIIDALASGDEERSKQAIRSHLLRTATRHARA